ncbi:hypothetical protein QTP88_024988 [Uroleucon formosanum]
MDWTDEECLLLIEMFKARPILWDPTNNYWSEIGKEMNKNVNEVKRKMESLQASFRRERRIEGNTSRSGAGADEVFHSKWFAFKAMHQLLEDPNLIVNETSIDECLGETLGEQTQEQRKTFVSPKKVACKRKKANDSDRDVITNLQNIMKDISDKRQTKKQKTDCTLFGEFIGSKLEQFDDRMKTILQHQISSLISNAELSKFQPPANQYQETNNSQIATSLPHFQSMYSIPSQSTGTHHASTSSPSISSIIAVHTSGTMDEIGDFDTLKSNDKLAKESPVAKYRRVKASLSFAGIDSLNFVSSFLILGSIKLSKLLNVSGVIL